MTDQALKQRSWARQQLAAVTYGIEIRNVSIMFESDWDRIAQTIEPQLGTCHPVVDEFFATKFSPLTTSWIHHHPLLDVIGPAFDRYLVIMRGCFDFTKPNYVALVKQKT